MTQALLECAMILIAYWLRPRVKPPWERVKPRQPKSRQGSAMGVKKA